MVMLFPVLFVGWKIIHKTKLQKPHQVDLIKGLAEIDEYERNFVPQESTYVLLREFWNMRSNIRTTVVCTVGLDASAMLAPNAAMPLLCYRYQA